MFIHTSHKMPDEHDMIRPYRLSMQGHARFCWSSVTLPIVALNARAHEVFPGIKTPTRPRHNVVHGQRDFGFPAVLTTVTITTQDVFARKDDFLVWNTDVNREADDAWKRHRYGHRVERFSFTGGNQFGLAQIQENNCLLYITDTQGLIVMIQDEHLTVHFPV